ncbi:MAG: MerR family transcriptional regulator [Deltaproteobacteria bacterium]|nr:MerR family transcriptional regulator [Deltaproteobacteria bacterium]
MKTNQVTSTSAPLISKEGIDVGEVSTILNVPRSTILFWEKEFSSVLNVKRTEGKHRRFTSKDVEVLGDIKRLLNEEKYTIAGAKRRLEITKQQSKSFEQILTEAMGKVQQGMNISDVAKKMARELVVLGLVSSAWVWYLSC